MIKFTKVVVLIVLVGVVGGCRGYRSDKPAIHPNPNMDWQAKIKAQSSPMVPPEGVVAWGSEKGFSDADDRERHLRPNNSYYTGKRGGEWVRRAPITVDRALMKRGQERFNIYCAVCHDRAGTGKGMVVQRGFVPPPNFSDQRLLAGSDGQLFDVISNGIRTMPGYAKQIDVADRWAIVAYVRALQKMRTATLSDVPARKRGELK